MTEYQKTMLAARGAFLHERMGGKTRPLPAGQGEDLSKSRYRLWQEKAGGTGGNRTFLKRLKLGNLTGAMAREILRDPVWNEDYSVPDWVTVIDEIMKLFPADVAELQQEMFLAAEKENLSNQHMVWAVLPFVDYAEGLLQKKLGPDVELFSPRSFSNMSASLVNSLSTLCFNTLQYRYRIYAAAKNPVNFLLNIKRTRKEELLNQQQFTEHVLKEGWREILLEFPVLARFIATTISQWVENYTAMAVFLKKDTKSLEKVFCDGKPLGQVQAIEAYWSDPHNHGKCVNILSFASGIRLVFKPRSLSIDRSWSKFNDWLGQNGMTSFIKTPVVFDGGDHGWAEFIERLPLKDSKEAEEFYFRAGVLLGLLYVLGGNDFHRENLIARGACPILVDTETLLLHRVRPFQIDAAGMDAACKALDVLSDSVLRTGLLPVWKVDASGRSEDLSALLGGSEKDGNLPVLSGKQLTVRDYREKLLEGFSHIYDFMLAHQEALIGPESSFDLFKQSNFRFLIRNSQIYGDILDHTTKPEFLRDGLLYSLEIERLAPAYLLSSSEEILPEVWSLYLSESEALHRRDIPLFYGEAEGLAIKDESGVVYGDYFLQSAVARAKELAGRLSPADKKTQLGLIENVLSIYEKNPHEPSAPIPARAKIRLDRLPGFDYGLLIDEAEKIYEQIINMAITGSSGEITWIVQQHDIRTQRLTLGRIGFSFYDGILGLGLYMSALYHLTKKPEIKDNALRTVDGFRKILTDTENPLPVRRLTLGLAGGVAGMARTLTAMGDYLEDASLCRDARRILHNIQPQQIEEDKAFDVMAGCAGLILVLVEAYKRFGDEKLLQAARWCGQRLLSVRIAAKSGHMVWDSEFAEEPLTGLGHGAAGIALALLQLYEYTRDRNYYDGALEALDYESGLYDERYKNWPDLRSNPRKTGGEQYFMAGWCSGAPGIGLARIAGLDRLNSDAARKDIENAIAFTLNYPLDSSDHVCCGNSGRVDFLVEAAVKLGWPELLAEARQRMMAMVLRKRQTGAYTLNSSSTGAVVYNPSFFQGTAGIGYEILRCLEPEKICSVLY